MPKQLVMQPCFINYGGDAGSQPAMAGDVVEPDADTAIALARMGRTLYVNKADDPTKGQHTASAEMIKAAQSAAKAKADADKAAAANPPAA